MKLPLRILAMGLMIPALGQAAGYEKNILFGAHAGGLAGIASTYVTGAESVYFNPAGLAAQKSDQEVAFDLSPTWSTFKGPINNQNEVVTGAQTMSPIFGLLYSAKLSDKSGIGVGAYVSGGARAQFDDVAFTGYNGTAQVYTNLSVTELALAYAGQATENLRWGVAWRYVMASASFGATARPNALAVTSVEITGLKATQPLAFKGGLQYKLGDKANISFVWRTEAQLDASGGETGGKIISPAAPTMIQPGASSARTVFPTAITLGYDRTLSDNWTFFTEYVFTQYSKVYSVEVKTESTTFNSTGGQVSLAQQWKDQHSLRLASEYRGWGMPFRFGYVYTSPVTNTDYPRAAFAPPAVAHTLTVGSGYNMLQNKAEFDWGLEYTTSSGDGGTNAAGTSGLGADYRMGTYSVAAYSLHMGFKYGF